MNLKEYVDKIKDLEISIYKQQSLCENLKEQVSYLRQPYQHKKFLPVQEYGKGIGDALKLIILGGALGCGLCFVLGGTDSILFDLCVISGGIVLGLLIYVILRMLYGKKTKAWKEEIAEKNRKIAIQNAHIIEKSKNQLQHIEPQLKKVEKLYKQTTAILENYYNEDIIFEKYRSLVPVCMFYEYLTSGKCRELEGPDGAYILYENELRSGIILGKLDEIIDNLDSIENNQYILAASLKKANQQISQLRNLIETGMLEWKNRDQDLQLTAFYHKIASANIAYSAWLDNQHR